MAVEPLQVDDVKEDDIFHSDSNDECESVEIPDDSTWTLNPDVQEFFPENCGSQEDMTQSDNITTNETDDIASLMNVFPHLSVQEVAEMYESQTINMTLDPTFAMTLQSYFGSPAPPDYLMKLPQDEMLSLDISLSFAKIIFSIWQQNVITKLNDDKLVSRETSLKSNDEFPTPQPMSTSTTAKTVLAPNAASHYEDQMINTAIEV